MGETLINLLSAGLRSSAFEPLLHGTELFIPGLGKIHFQVSSIQRMPVTVPFRFQEFCYCAKIEAGGQVESGYGDSRFQLLALQKAIAEAFERVLFRLTKNGLLGTLTSSGWAAHVTRSQAEQAALGELLERDSVLVQWLNGEPWSEISPETLPNWLSQWAIKTLPRTRFPRLRVLMSRLGHVPTVSVLLVDQKSRGVIAHGAGLSLHEGLTRALVEVCRLARMAVSGQHQNAARRFFDDAPLDQALGACEQAMAYADHHSVPSWIFGTKISWKTAQALWSSHRTRFQSKGVSYKFVEITRGPLFVGYCQSEAVQNLYFGRTHDAVAAGLINFNRIAHGTFRREFHSKLPHFVA